ncbi:metalloregulator ArsR/SmtB family transcription factor [Loktanella sp. F6476L]|uniref:ArsR/SmtB family transcription factor n=1 Tax=Loktanella sp. F6476L TaxID=2926405 RepID=UPI001FF6C4DA|nr:metalloregulator ArsR/SmtB family transcription factor [Loktanella sp. F6476L]MCK0119482.1 metalloregulator ArsR/SmtB family transcription factor [Loktanella sp. F6476L]
MTYEMTIAALADPTRRAILACLRDGPLAVGALAEGLPVSRPAVSQHLKVLSDAGLLKVSQHGTKRLYTIDPRGADDLRRYLDSMWDDALDAFAKAARDKAAQKDKS